MVGLLKSGVKGELDLDGIVEQRSSPRVSTEGFDEKGERVFYTRPRFYGRQNKDDLNHAVAGSQLSDASFAGSSSMRENF
ncbi:MAG: hypothetical protein V1851_01905 [Patescibacteria group bacterium]